MIEGKVTISAFSGRVLRKMRAHALTSWPLAVIWTLCVAAALFASARDLSPELTTSFVIVSIVGLIIWEVSVLRALTAANYKGGQTELRYVFSVFLYVIILILGFVLLLFPVVLSTMALWALVSFEFDGPEPTQEELTASFEAFQAHPLFALCVAIFIAGIAGVFALMMRGCAFAAASVAERRIVAMEAFQWTRRFTVFLLGSGLLVLVPFFLLTAGAGTIMEGVRGDGTVVQLAATALFALTLWPLMLAFQVLSAETYKRFRTQERNSPQPEAL